MLHGHALVDKEIKSIAIFYKIYMILIIANSGEILRSTFMSTLKKPRVGTQTAASGRGIDLDHGTSAPRTPFYAYYRSLRGPGFGNGVFRQVPRTRADERNDGQSRIHTCGTIM